MTLSPDQITQILVALAAVFTALATVLAQRGPTVARARRRRRRAAVG